MGEVIFLCAGGTGGHIFPAEALGAELVRRGHKPVLLTDRRFLQFTAAVEGMQAAGIPIHPLSASSPRGGIVKKCKGLLQLLGGMWQAGKLVRTLKPAAVVGFGGYPSFPGVAMGLRASLPVVLHEQNAVLGKANRMLGRAATRIALSFADTGRVKPQWRGKTVHVGNPVRAAVRAVRGAPYPALTAEGPVHLLVVGGSLGARVFSKVIPEALAGLPEALRHRLRLVQQCRAEDGDAVRTAYDRAGIQAELAPFFADIPARLAASHLVIARAGASTVTELLAVARPGLLVPLPSAADNHQFFNAQALEQAGGGEAMEEKRFTPEALRAKLEALLVDPTRLTQAANALRSLPELDAAALLADEVERLITR